jgi:hypothetical protein
MMNLKILKTAENASACLSAMVKKTILLFLFTSMATVTWSQKPDFTALVRSYIDRYKEIAIKEMMVYRVPASITLAQGILESNAGTSKLATEANNHFGIKCHKDWQGKTYSQDDDLPDECFRKYLNPEESFRDHSWFLTQRERYKGLFDLEVDDYKGWARGLKAAGYATNPAYADQLIRTVETYGLSQYDNANFPVAMAAVTPEQTADEIYRLMATRFEVAGLTPGGRHLFVNNELKLVVVRRGDNLSAIAADVDVPLRQLLKYNEMSSALAVKPGDLLYLEPKRRNAAAKSHQVRDGETLHAISQAYGVKLKVLVKRNALREGVEAPVGMMLRLR